MVPTVFRKNQPPVVTPSPKHRALCYDAFAILHSGEIKTAVYVAQKLNRASVADADEKRSDKFFADARLPYIEISSLTVNNVPSISLMAAPAPGHSEPSAGTVFARHTPLLPSL